VNFSREGSSDTKYKCDKIKCNIYPRSGTSKPGPGKKIYPYSIPLQKTSFANRQPDPAFQVSEIPIFTPDLCKASLAAIRLTRLATKPALIEHGLLVVT
jgi:hypothetical protein